MGDRWDLAGLARVPPASGAVVMGTGIVSVDLALGGAEGLSRVVLAAAAAAWAVLGVVFVSRAIAGWDGLWRDARSPAALTGAAGTAVLGTRLLMLGWSAVAAALLVIAAALLAVVVVPVARHWQTPTVGASFMVTVAVEALAVLASELAASQRAAWLLWVAVGAWLLGLGLYPFVLRRFRLSELRAGRGDQWVVGGSLAIAALATGRITVDGARLDVLGGLHGTFEVISVVVWVLAVLWLPALVVGELRGPYRRYEIRRWATVFPIGMYGAGTRLVAGAAHIPALTTPARVWTWVAFATWVVACAGLAGRMMGRDAPRRDRRRCDDERRR